jgi:hypothetical protein
MNHLLRPSLLAVLAISSFSPAAAAHVHGVQSEALPSAREVIERHVTAAKLKPRVETTKSMHVVGTFSVPAAGINGTMDTWHAKPDLHYATVELGGFGKMVAGYDGKTGWMIQPMMGARILSGTELMQAKLEAEYDSALKPESRYESMRTVGRETFEGKDCYKVELIVKPQGDLDAEKTKAARTTKEYYEVATGLLLGSEGYQAGEMAEGPITSVFSDYKDFGGQLMAAKTVVRTGGQELVLTVDKVEFDTAGADTFAPPAEIRTLVEADAAKAASAGAPKPK